MSSTIAAKYRRPRPPSVTATPYLRGLYQEIGLVKDDRDYDWIDSVGSAGPYFNYPEAAEAGYVQNTWYFLIDDPIDEGLMPEADQRTFINRIKGVMSDKLAPETSIEKLTGIFRDKVRARCGARTYLFQRFVAEHLAWLDSIIIYNAHQAIKDIDRATFFALRETNVGVRPLWPVNEAFIDLDLSVAFFVNTYVLRLQTLTLHHLIIVNDLFSAHQDIKRSRHCNIAAINMRIHGDDADTTVAALYRELAAIEKEFETVAELLCTACEYLPETLEERGKYIDILRREMAGNVEWSTNCGRYQGPDSLLPFMRKIENHVPANCLLNALIDKPKEREPGRLRPPAT
jgi:hypothetical protein